MVLTTRVLAVRTRDLITFTRISIQHTKNTRFSKEDLAALRIHELAAFSTSDLQRSVTRVASVDQHESAAFIKCPRILPTILESYPENSANRADETPANPANTPHRLERISDLIARRESPAPLFLLPKMGVVPRRELNWTGYTQSLPVQDSLAGYTQRLHVQPTFARGTLVKSTCSMRTSRRPPCDSFYCPRQVLGQLNLAGYTQSQPVQPTCVRGTLGYVTCSMRLFLLPQTGGVRSTQLAGYKQIMRVQPTVVGGILGKDTCSMRILHISDISGNTLSATSLTTCVSGLGFRV